MTETDTQPQQAAESPTTPPYAPFSSVFNHLKKTKEAKVVPSRVDTTLLNGMSGSGRHQLIHALRFLGLIGEGNATQPVFKELVDALDTPEWAPKFAKVVNTTYASIVRDVDLAAGTLGQLQEAFKETKVKEGQVLEKCIRFYLSAMASAKQDVSPHFKIRQQSSRSSSPKRGAADAPDDDDVDAAIETADEFVSPAAATPVSQPKKKAGKSAPPEPQRVDQQPPGMRKYPLHVPGKPMGFILVPENMTEEECVFLDHAVQTIKSFARMVRPAKPAKGKAQNSKEATA